jgi:hypothetical protein
MISSPNARIRGNFSVCIALFNTYTPPAKNTINNHVENTVFVIGSPNIYQPGIIDHFGGMICGPECTVVCISVDGVCISPVLCTDVDTTVSCGVCVGLADTDVHVPNNVDTETRDAMRNLLYMCIKREEYIEK